MGALGKGIKKYRVLKNWEEGEERKGRGRVGGSYFNVAF